MAKGWLTENGLVREVAMYAAKAAGKNRYAIAVTEPAGRAR